MKTTFIYLAQIMSFTALLISNPLEAQNKKRTNNYIMDTIVLNSSNNNPQLVVEIKKGASFNHPTFAIWIEDLNGKILETIFVTQSFGSGIFGHADAGNGTWQDKPGESLRPAALPYWSHKRNKISRDSLYVPTPENPVPDAITGPTPEGDFVLITGSSYELPDTFKVMLEINQTWDWNEYWTNKKFSNDSDYKSSSQPSVVYSTVIETEESVLLYELIPIGHGHYSGKDGKLYKDLSTLSTALNIIEKITVSVSN